MRDLLVRTYAKWIEEGEKTTKYFFAHEKRNYINKTVSKLIDNNRITVQLHKKYFKKLKPFIRHYTAIKIMNYALLIQKTLLISTK